MLEHPIELTESDERILRALLADLDAGRGEVARVTNRTTRERLRYKLDRARIVSASGVSSGHIPALSLQGRLHERHSESTQRT